MPVLCILVANVEAIAGLRRDKNCKALAASQKSVTYGKIETA